VDGETSYFVVLCVNLSQTVGDTSNDYQEVTYALLIGTRSMTLDNDELL